MFLQNFIHKKITVTVLFLLISFTMLAQDAAAAKPVTLGTNLLALLLVITIVLLAFVIWALGQVLIALSRQLLEKDKPVIKVAAIAAVLILSMLSQTVLAQTIAAADEAATVVSNYGGLSANTF